eukprot:scaffold1149_cov165-Amphora_coffeaeformis.AAC.9
MARLRDSFLAGEFPDLKKKANHGFGPEPSSWPCESHRCDEGATLLAFTSWLLQQGNSDDDDDDDDDDLFYYIDPTPTQ